MYIIYITLEYIIYTQLPINPQAAITHTLGWVNLGAAWNLGPGWHDLATPPA